MKTLPTSSDLARIPGFSPWLQDRSWQDMFDHRSLRRSRSYANGSGIVEIKFARLDSGVLLTGSVFGTASSPYRVEIFVDAEMEDFEAECSCPVGVFCKHGAAVLGRLAEISKGEESTKSAKIDAPVRLRGEALMWMHSLEEAASPEPPKPSTTDPGFLAYCIEPYQDQHREGYRLVLRKAKRLKSGELRVDTGEAVADPSKPARYMHDSDADIASLVHRLHKAHSSWERYGSLLRGKEWPRALQKAHELDRLFFTPQKEKHSSTGWDSRIQAREYRQVSWADPTTATAEWVTTDDGGTRPQVAVSAPDSAFLPTDPPLYLNVVKAEVGPVESSMPASMLTVWADGPVLLADEVAPVSQRLERVSASSTASPHLPAPKGLELVELPVSDPKPHLHIRMRDIERYSHREVLVGEIGFSYEGSSIVFSQQSNSAPERESWIEGSRRFVLTRQRKKERQLESRLDGLGFHPLREIALSLNSDPTLNRAVIPSDKESEIRFAWLRFLTNDAELLRKEGWEVVADENTRLQIIDLGDFVPALEADSDHGIDWFRFEISADQDGKKISLIPMIAEAIASGIPEEGAEIPEYVFVPCENPEDGFYRFPGDRFYAICRQVAHLFLGQTGNGELRIDRLTAAGLADELEIDDSATVRTLRKLAGQLRSVSGVPQVKPPAKLKAELRPYQLEGYQWLRFLAKVGLNGILADDMGLGKTVQTLAFLASRKKASGPSLVIAPTSVIGNWQAEVERFVPSMTALLLQGPDRKSDFDRIPESDLVLTSYPLLTRDFDILSAQEWDVVVLDEAQYIKNPKTASARNACNLTAQHRLCLSGTPMENHLGELWSLSRFLMPGFLGDEKSFSATIRRPIERDQDQVAQLALNRKVSPLILRRLKDEVADDLPPKTEIIHKVQLGKKEIDLYESVRAAMDKRVRDAMEAKGLAKSHIIVLTALLKLRQVCCHPALLKTADAKKMKDAAKFCFLTERLLPELVAEGRRILLFSQFTEMLALIENGLKNEGIDYLKLTGNTKNRPALVKQFQEGEVPIFLISLKAGGTGLNLTAADTVIHYDPWWNPAVEAQATDRAHRIGQDKPVFVHKLICEGSIEERIVELQERKSALVSALLSEEASKLKIDQETLGHLLAPLGVETG